MMPNKELPAAPTLQKKFIPENESKWWTNPFSLNKWAVYSSHRTIWALPCLVSQFLGLKWAGNSSTGISAAPQTPNGDGMCSMQRGAAVCQVTALCWYILLSSIMMWWPPLMKCMLSAGDLENKCSSAAREVAGLGKRNKCESNICFCRVFCPCGGGFPAPRGHSCHIDDPFVCQKFHFFSSPLVFVFFNFLLHLFGRNLPLLLGFFWDNYPVCKGCYSCSSFNQKLNNGLVSTIPHWNSTEGIVGE